MAKKKPAPVLEKRLNLTQTVALVIIVVMVGSSIAFSLLSGSGTPTDSTTPPLVPDSPGTPLNYTATVNGTVQSLAPSFSIFSPTLEPDISKIDAIIANVQGLRQFSSRFRQDPNGFLVYSADISFDAKKTSFEEVSQSIVSNAQGVLLSVSFAKNGFVQVAPGVEFYNEDLNVTRTFALTNLLVSALLEKESLPGDSLQVQLLATFTGNNLTALRAVEAANSNANTAPKDHSITLPLTIKQLEPGMGFSAKSSWRPNQAAPLAEEIESELKSISVVTDAKAEIAPSETLLFSVNDDLDLNSFFAFLAPIHQTNAVTPLTAVKPYGFSIAVSNLADANSVYLQLQTYFEEHNVPAAAVSFEPVADISIELALQNADADMMQLQNSARAITDLFSIDPAFYRWVLLDANFLPENVLDQNQNGFVVPGGTVQARTVLSAQTGQEKTFVVQYSTVRNTVTQAQGMDTELVSNQN